MATLFTDEPVSVFIQNVAGEHRKKDSMRLIELMTEITGEVPAMYGSSIIGFGKYQYRYASGHRGIAPLLAFSPRKAAISLYIFSGSEEDTELLANLGKFTMGKTCIYAKRLDDLEEGSLRLLMRKTVDFLCKTYHRMV